MADSARRDIRVDDIVILTNTETTRSETFVIVEIGSGVIRIREKYGLYVGPYDNDEILDIVLRDGVWSILGEHSKDTIEFKPMDEAAASGTDIKVLEDYLIYTANSDNIYLIEDGSETFQLLDIHTGNISSVKLQTPQKRMVFVEGVRDESEEDGDIVDLIMINPRDPQRDRSRVELKGEIHSNIQNDRPGGGIIKDYPLDGRELLNPILSDLDKTYASAETMFELLGSKYFVQILSSHDFTPIIVLFGKINTTNTILTTRGSVRQYLGYYVNRKEIIDHSLRSGDEPSNLGLEAIVIPLQNTVVVWYYLVNSRTHDLLNIEHSNIVMFMIPRLTKAAR